MWNKQNLVAIFTAAAASFALLVPLILMLA